MMPSIVRNACALDIGNLKELLLLPAFGLSDNGRNVSSEAFETLWRQWNG